MLGPLCVAALLVPILISLAGTAFKLSCAAVSCIIGPACYFHLKHLLIPDVDYGVVRCLRGYMIVAMYIPQLVMLGKKILSRKKTPQA